MGGCASGDAQNSIQGNLAAERDERQQQAGPAQMRRPGRSFALTLNVGNGWKADIPPM